MFERVVMQEILVRQEESGQRLDKYLRRRLPLAPSSFIYKMLRKKNITLRGKKADGSEKVETGDSIKLFLSERQSGRRRRSTRPTESSSLCWDPRLYCMKTSISCWCESRPVCSPRRRMPVICP